MTTKYDKLRTAIIASPNTPAKDFAKKFRLDKQPVYNVISQLRNQGKIPKVGEEATPTKMVIPAGVTCQVSQDTVSITGEHGEIAINGAGINYKGKIIPYAVLDVLATM